MNQAFLDYYRCPQQFADFKPADGKRGGKTSGEFRADLSGVCENGVESQDDGNGESACFLAFDPSAMADHLRYERYVDRVPEPSWRKATREAYYRVRPALPVAVRRHMQRIWLKGWDKKPFPSWPVDRTVDRMFEGLMALSLRAQHNSRIPFVWFWPEGKSACAILTHDVETASGLKFVNELMDIDDSFGIKSSFQLIPEARYVVTEEILSEIRGRGFEINVHDLKHDGRLFENHGEFLQSAARINAHAERFGSRGFRAGALYRNLDWYDSFSFSYDMSVPNVAHLDPQKGGCCTVLPYFVGNVLELPVTATQDYSLFKILGTYSLDLWREQIRQIIGQHGLVSFIVHPDYLDSGKAKSTYAALLKHLAELRSGAGLWTVLPGEVDTWWRQRSEMKLLPDGGSWRIEGEGAERASVAYATLENNTVTYSLI